MSGSNPKYLPVPKKVPYNIRLPKPLLDKLNAYAELTGNTTTDVVIGALDDLMKGKVIFNDYLPDMKGITIRLPIIPDEKKEFYNVNLINAEISAGNLFNEAYGYYATTETYEILKIPNNLDEFNEFIGYHTMINKVGKPDNHSGIEFVIIPDIAMEYDNVMDALYCLYFEVESNKLKKILLIDYVDAINKANATENVKLKNKLTLCVKELQQLNLELEETMSDDIDAIENYTYESITDIADKYNTGNIVELGDNINEAIVDAEMKQNPEYVDGIIYDKVEVIVGEKIDGILADHVAAIVDEKLSNIEKLVMDGKSKDEILSAIENNRIKTNND